MSRALAFVMTAAMIVVPWAEAASPVISDPNLSGTAGDAGWWRSNVTITWIIDLQGGTVISVTGCQNETITSEGVHTRGCSVTTTGGTASIAPVEIKIDKTSPTISGIGLARAADQAGWYNAPVGIVATPSDAVSGPMPCSSSYSGPDSASASGSVTCRDVAGNGSTAPSPSFKYDNTAPSITGAAPGRAPDSNGWYNHAVSVGFTAADNLSGVAGCQAVTYSGPDGASAAVPSSCADVAGNASTGSATISYDGSGPSVSGSPDRSPDSNGWYSHAVNVSIGGSDATSGLAGCSGGGTYSGPDGRGQVTGSCTDKAGNSGSGGVEIPYDSTPPQVTGAAADRPPDANGWYNHGFSFTFQGTDAGSGVASCTSGSYGGPDGAAATVTGTCTDKAGHTSAPRQQNFKYDATPPSLSGVVAQVGNKFALLKWKLSSDVASVRVTRTPGRGGEASTVVYNGKADFYKDSGIDNRATYEYRVSASDEAANSTPEEKASAVPLPPLFNPSAGARVKAPILLEWLAVPNATFYNVQVWCGRRKILTAWPKRSRLVVPRVGKFAGKAYTLPRGACKWYVWPGRGRLTERRYGRLAGVSTFVHTR